MASMNETTSGLQPRKGRLQRFLPRPVLGTNSSPNSQEGLQGLDEQQHPLLSREVAENKERRLFMKAARSKSSISGLKDQEAARQQNQNIIESTVIRSEPGTLISRAHYVTALLSESQLEVINDQTSSSSAAAAYSGAIAVATSSSSRRSKPSAARNLSMLHLLPINTSGDFQAAEPPAVVRKLSNLGSPTWNILPSIKTSVAASKGTFLQRDSVAVISNHANHRYQADGEVIDGGADDCLLSSGPHQLAGTTGGTGNFIINKAGSDTPSSSGVSHHNVRLRNYSSLTTDLLPSPSRYNAAATTATTTTTTTTAALFNSSPANAGVAGGPASRLTTMQYMQQSPSASGRSNSLLLSSCRELLGDCTISGSGCSASSRRPSAGAGGGAAAVVTDGSLASPKISDAAALPLLPPAATLFMSSNIEIRSGSSIPTRENDLLAIASRMGMVRRKGLSDPRLDLRAPSARPGANSAHRPAREQMSAWRLSRAHSNNTESQVSLLGVQYSVLLRFAANIQNDVSTQEVVHNHIMKQTSDQKKRYLDIISDTAILEVPEFYVIHP